METSQVHFVQKEPVSAQMNQHEPDISSEFTILPQILHEFSHLFGAGPLVGILPNPQGAFAAAHETLGDAVEALRVQHG